MMKEIKDIIAAYDRLLAEGSRTALATVVHVEGSSYRRPGARMLVNESGELTGAISGGCLEGDALRKALLAMLRQQSMLVTYDTNDEDDAVMGLGLGCNGIIQVLIEPILAEDENNPIRLLKQIVAQRRAYCLVTLFSLRDRKDAQPGTCFLFTADDARLDPIALAAREALNQQKSDIKDVVYKNREVTAFFEWIAEPIVLVIAGAGNDVVPLVQMAGILGWHTTLIDGRPAYANRAVFAGCSIIVSNPDKALEDIVIDDRVFFLLMTHNYNYDKALLQALLGRRVRYVGMLGPRKKLERILAEFSETGFVPAPTQLACIHSPVGLNLGADTPEGIALSIVAEIQALLAGRNAAPLYLHPGPIHERRPERMQ